MNGEKRQPVSGKTAATIAIVVIVVLACVVSFWASTSPDGLEAVAAKLGFDKAEADSLWHFAPFTDYEGAFGIPTWLARLIGTGTVLVVGALIAKAVAHFRPHHDSTSNRP